ncbi:MAG: DUF2975 domain-containing protein [Eubacterium sp.]|nr:DUF2975 domain-containing protein [Eubacterium sp.]
MENKSIKTINTVGKIGRIVSMILIVFMILAGVATLAGTIFASTLPKEDINLTVNGTADIESEGSLFKQFKEFIAVEQKDGKTDVDIVGGSNGIGVMSFDDDGLFSNAEIKDTQKGYSIDFNSKTVSFGLGRVIWGLVSTLIYIICIVITLFMIRALMRSIEKCESPFAQDVITNMKKFGFSLIPFVVLRSVVNSAWSSILKTGFDFSMDLDFTMVIAILIVFMLVMIFSYGADLQKQSDETL